MKISEITIKLLEEYLRIDDVTATDETILTAALTAAKEYVYAYCGIPYTVTDNKDTSGTEIITDNAGNVKTIVVSGGTTTTTIVDKDGNTLTALDNQDAHDDLWTSVMILVQDMYDNRSYYVDKANINATVDNILRMHVSASTFLGR